MSILHSTDICSKSHCSLIAVDPSHRITSGKNRQDPAPATLSKLSEHLYYETDFCHFIKDKFQKQHETIVKLQYKVKLY